MMIHLQITATEAQLLLNMIEKANIQGLVTMQTAMSLYNKVKNVLASPAANGVVEGLPEKGSDA